MIKDRAAIDLPDYLHILTGHYHRDSTYASVRSEGTDDYLLIATIAGGGRFTVGGSSFRTAPGDVVLIKPETPHDYRTAEECARWELLWAHFHPRPHWYDLMNWPEILPGIGLLSLLESGAGSSVLSGVRQSHREANSLHPHGAELAANSLERVLLLCDGLIDKSAKPIDRRVIAVMDYLVENLSKPAVIADLARRVHLSPSRMAHLFKEETGSSPIEYLDLQRIERAKILLIRTFERIGDIASAVGMDAVTFSIRFKRHTGQSPSAFRQLAQQSLQQNPSR